MKRKHLIVASIMFLILAAVVYAQTVNKMPYGIAIPYLYKYTLSSDTTDSYYLAPPTLSANDVIVGVDATQTLTNKTLTSPTLNSPTIATPTHNGGSSGQVWQSNGTSYAAVAKNLYRQAAIHNFQTLAASWNLSADEQLCLFLAATNANAACTIYDAAPTAGKIYIVRNATGQVLWLKKEAAGTGVQLTNAKTSIAYYDGVTGDFLKLCSEF